MGIWDGRRQRLREIYAISMTWWFKLANFKKIAPWSNNVAIYSKNLVWSGRRGCFCDTTLCRAWNGQINRLNSFLRVMISIILNCFKIMKSIFLITFTQSAGAVEYTDCTSAEGYDPAPTSTLGITQNNLMVRLQEYWSFGECRVLLHFHWCQVHSSPEW